MKRIILYASILTCAWWPSMRAESAALQQMREATALRQQIALAVGEGVMTPAEGLQLLGEKNPVGTTSDQADWIYEVLDLGHRLRAARHNREAAPFFRAAASALQQKVEQTPDGRREEKARYLRDLAWIRLELLNQPAQAALDVERALRLVPHDGSLQRLHHQTAVRSGDREKAQRLEHAAREVSP